ncbi:GntR family transcriptional regulator [Maribacter sp. 2210JD10-5]|uniref:GntR family transcriptional regulator n=1 Tax=Maribacter sp. 2210JD10-5 TaxID=3386272 RepID=UPI0039BCE188
MNKISIDVLGNVAYKTVKEMILTNALEPGEKIIQDKLALALGISRTPLRSALKMLEAEYLVESIPRRGVFVKGFSDSEVIEIYECRIALECTAIRLFTEKATDEEIDELASIFNPYQNKKKINLSKYLKSDVLFHETIIKNCKNNFLNKLVQQGNLLSCIDRIGLIRPPQETLKEHMNIIKAIKERDVDKAEQLCNYHLTKSKILINEKSENEE